MLNGTLGLLVRGRHVVLYWTSCRKSGLRRRSWLRCRLAHFRFGEMVDTNRLQGVANRCGSLPSHVGRVPSSCNISSSLRIECCLVNAILPVTTPAPFIPTLLVKLCRFGTTCSTRDSRAARLAGRNSRTPESVLNMPNSPKYVLTFVLCSVYSIDISVGLYPLLRTVSGNLVTELSGLFVVGFSPDDRIGEVKFWAWTSEPTTQIGQLAGSNTYSFFVDISNPDFGFKYLLHQPGCENP